MYPDNEPPIDPLADTNPSVTIHPEDLRPRHELPVWRRALGLLSLLLAAGLTVATLLLFAAPAPPPAPELTAQALTPMPTPTPTTAADSAPPPTQAGPLPTVAAGQIGVLLAAPLMPIEQAAAYDPDARGRYNPFTVIPVRQRTEVEEYTIVRGDTISGIAQRYGLQQESIAWSNDRRIVWTLYPGDVIFIPPADGVYLFQGTTGSRTIAEYAAQYGVDDPFVVLDSIYNPHLASMNPDTIPPSGTRFFIPGGQGEQITWTPPITEEEATIGGVTGNFVTFAPGEAGSCGPVLRGGGTVWSNPLPNGTWTRGFSGWHTGVDLAAPVGTPVYAANGGNVIFRGWNSWGYGYAIVISHGPFLTLYGHLSEIYVSCGQTVSAGQSIGAVGNTGNSSGPHLHFEVRYGDTPTDPAAIFPF
ncbi:MAG: M23 family metallopeptidase [Chloroflexi bacterium]|nr:M23 family metallopeptidase [Chloroflexota bacterium]